LKLKAFALGLEALSRQFLVAIPFVLCRWRRATPFSAEYNAENKLERLKQLEQVVESLDGEQSVLVASAFSHMLTLGNIAGEPRHKVA